MRWGWLCVAALLVGCGEEEAAPPREEFVPRPDFTWRPVASARGTALRLENFEGMLMLNLACVPDPGRLAASVPDFSPRGSEERLTLGAGDELTVLVVDPAAQSGAGVRGEAPLPEAWLTRFAGGARVGASYGAQTLGPVDGPPPAVAARFVETCRALP